MFLLNRFNYLLKYVNAILTLLYFLNAIKK